MSAIPDEQQLRLRCVCAASVRCGLPPDRLLTTDVARQVSNRNERLVWEQERGEAGVGRTSCAESVEHKYRRVCNSCALRVRSGVASLGN